MFSKSCKYGIKAVLYIAQQSQLGIRVGIKEIVEAIDTPEAFTAKVLQTLSKKNIVNSVKGPNGGFEIPKERLVEIKLSNIVEAIDGEDMYTQCALGLPKCGFEKPCPVHHKFVVVKNELRYVLENTTVLEVAHKMNTIDLYLKL